MDAGLANLKVGDRVVVVSGPSYARNRGTGTIVGETTTCWRVRTGKNVAGEDIITLYYKKDGNQRGGGEWNCGYIESDPDGSKIAALVTERTRRNKASSLNKAVIWERLTMAQLEAIEKIVSGN